MNGAVLVIITMVWLVFVAKDFPFKRKSGDKKENFIYFVFHAGAFFLYLCVLFDYQPPMPTRWVNQTVGALIKSMIERVG